MITGLDYWIDSDSLTVCRVYGTGSLAQLPAGVGEMKITALADHTFAQYPSDEIAHHEIFRAVRSIRESAGDGSFLWHTGPVSDVGTPDEPLCGPKVEEIVLPPYLTVPPPETVPPSEGSVESCISCSMNWTFTFDFP